MLRTTVRVNAWAVGITKKQWTPAQRKGFEALNKNLSYCIGLLERRRNKSGGRHYFREKKAA